MARLALLRFLLAAASLSAVEARAGLFSATPTILVRHSPPKPIKRLYVVYVGSLSEMATAEEEVAKDLAKSRVEVMKATDDVSDVNELKSDAVQNKIMARMQGEGALMVAKPLKIAGSEITFQIRLSDSSGELVTGEVMLDTTNQLTVSSGEAQAMRIAIRDAVRRFLTDKRIVQMFQSAK